MLPGSHSPLKQDISVAKQIDLNYKENFSISYSAINFTPPQRNRYAYILKSFNKSWNYVGSATTAYYINLDPGEYLFVVRACNNDGIWNNTGVQIRLITGVGLISSTILSRIVTPVMYKLIPPSLENDDEKA